MTSPHADHPEPGEFQLSGAVFARRGGKILILKRAGGSEMSGAWYLPGGGVDRGETPEQAARRELFEEAGLVPAGPLTLIGLVPMHAYGRDRVQAVYASDCEEGDVRLSNEHTGFRWVDPVEYRDRYFGDEQLQRVAEGDPRRAAIVAGARRNLDEYIAWQEHQFEDIQLRLLGLTAEMYVVRDGRILLLKRKGGIGDGVWYVPGGVTDKGEDPLAAAVRETYEEAGLWIERPEHLRTWSWAAQNNRDAYHAAYIGPAPAGDVRLSNEHSGFRWLTPSEYSERYLSEAIEASAPQFASWFRGVRENVVLAREWIEGRAQG